MKSSSQKKRLTPFQWVMRVIVYFGLINLILSLVFGLVILLSSLSHLQQGSNTLAVISLEYFSFLGSGAFVTIPIAISMFLSIIWGLCKTEKYSGPGSPSDVKWGNFIELYADKFLNFLSGTSEKIAHWYHN
jgi:hypothetical protein